jgi:hypothetical protein
MQEYATNHQLINPTDPGPKWDERRPGGTYGSATVKKVLAEQPEVTPGAEWPAVRAEAFHGLAGEFVRAIEPSTEADPVALLTHLLVAFGNAVGHGPHSMVEDTRHAENLFAVMVGATSEARKGTACDRVVKAMSAVDSEWADSHIESGMTSGEGVAYAVRDGDGKEDAGIADKRLMVVETEFASVLKNIGREGNILSPMTRQAWDSGNLRTLNKKNPVRASGAHISIIGHITSEELRRCLTETEMANGFGNRFLWLCVRRSKFLPEGGNSGLMSLRSLMSRLSKSLAFAKGVGEMKRDSEARELWAYVYRDLVTLPPGLLGALTSRGAPIVQRLSCLYALLDLSSEVRVEHLKAALAVWAYAERSVRYIFGDALGDSVADQILRALASAGAAGLTRTGIRDLFGRHLSAARINLAFEYLLTLGKVVKVSESTSGRPTETWFLKGIK